MVAVNGNIKEYSLDEFYCPSPFLKSREIMLKQLIEERYCVNLESYRDLHAWSCEHYAEFWEIVLHFCDIKLSKNYTQVVDVTKGIHEFPTWFSGATLNYTENCIRGNDSDVAFISASSSLDLSFYSYKNLREDIQSVATSLRSIGVGPEDSVCGFLPNTYETAVAMFATAAIGATWSSASVDFGPTGVLDRFRQVKPKVLFTVEAVTYKGKRFDLSERINQVVLGLPDLQKVVQINFNSDVNFEKYQFPDKFVSYDSFKAPINEIPVPFVYEQVAFSHPLFVMFSSGTTGTPKAIVHTVGGTLLKHVEEHLIQGDSQRSDRMFFYTTCGWMMWNW